MARKAYIHPNEPYPELVVIDNDKTEDDVDEDIRTMLGVSLILEPKQWLDGKSKPNRIGEGIRWHIKKQPRRGPRNTSGIPDLLIWLYGHPNIIGFESKAPHDTLRPTKTYPEQELGATVGAFYIVRSAAQVEAVLEDITRKL